MTTKDLTFPPGAMSIHIAQHYVGGKVVFDALREAFPERVKPFYLSQRLKVYRRADLDAAIDEARAQKIPLTNPNS